MSVTQNADAAGTARRPLRPTAAPPQRGGGGGIRGREGVAGWLFIAPVVVILGLFLVVPIVMAAWVSVSDWAGQGSPFSASVRFIGTGNYSKLLTRDGLARSDFMLSLRNNFYYVLLVVPLQTVLALGLALVLNGRRLKGKGFFRTAYYFPSVTSSVAIAAVFLFLFSGGGVVNALLSAVGVNGPQWFADPRGLLHLLLSGVGLVDINNPPSALAGTDILGISAWDWLAGPSVAMCAIVALVVWTTAGTFMLMFLAALQDIPVEVDEAAQIDGASRWQSFRHVTVPILRPAFLLVLTLGLIGTWQVFDQIYLMGKGNPAKTTLTPAFQSFQTAFNSQNWGQGSAIAFLLFALILVLSAAQRWLLRDKDDARERRLAKRRPRRAGTTAEVSR